MKKIFLLMITFILLVCSFNLFACSTPDGNSDYNGEYDDLMTSVVLELEDSWQEIYSETPMIENRDNKIHIKSTRIIILKDSHDIEVFENIKYIVEFTIYSDYYGTNGKYFLNVGICDTVVVYKDGTIEAQPRNLINQYLSVYFDFEFSYISNIVELNSIYNQTITLN